MKGEINKDFYCSANRFSQGICDLCKNGGSATFYCWENCSCRHRKFPTPLQYEKEYGEKYPDTGATYVLVRNGEWQVWEYKFAKEAYYDCLIICACTPWSCPSKDWRPHV